MLKSVHCDIRVRSGSLEHFLRARLCKICCGDRTRGSDHHLLGTSSIQHSHVEDSETTDGRVRLSLRHPLFSSCTLPKNEGEDYMLRRVAGPTKNVCVVLQVL